MRPSRPPANQATKQPRPRGDGSPRPREQLSRSRFAPALLWHTALTCHIHAAAISCSHPQAYTPSSSMQVDTLLVKSLASSHPETSTVAIALLRSFERMGSAVITCVSGCSCAPVSACGERIEGESGRISGGRGGWEGAGGQGSPPLSYPQTHSPSSSPVPCCPSRQETVNLTIAERHSPVRMHGVSVTQSEQCLMSVAVGAEPGPSGGFKVRRGADRLSDAVEKKRHI